MEVHGNGGKIPDGILLIPCAIQKFFQGRVSAYVEMLHELRPFMN